MNTGKKKLINDLSANTLQTVIIQSFSLIIFYFTSRYLLKEELGEYNWCMAVGSTIIALASFGLDVVLVKRVASGQNPILVTGIHFLHTIMVALVFVVLVLLYLAFSPSFKQVHGLFFLVALNLGITNIATSFKLCLTGLEKFKPLAIIALIANVIKLALVLLLFILKQFNVVNVVYVFIFSSLLELAVSYVFVTKNLGQRLRPVIAWTSYSNLVKESLPQLGVVFFDSALARIDWILIGILSTGLATADYSFTYRMYESSKLPLIVITPILLTRFSRLFANPAAINDKNRTEITAFFKLELFAVTLIPVVLCCCWSPVIDFLTNNKYGTVNETTYMILAACVPLHAIINYLWSMGFAQGQLKAIMFITIAVTIFNFLLNLLVIPLYGSIGAALVFLFSTLFQAVLYVIFMKQIHIQLSIASCIVALSTAVISVATARFITNNATFATVIALALATGLALVTGQVNVKKLRSIMFAK